MPPATLPPDLARLAAAGAHPGAVRAPAPVESWDPPECGPIDLSIDADGAWRHDGHPIARAALVRLFASVLRQDADGVTWLVTPREKCRVTVADVAFLAVDMTVSGAAQTQSLAFRTNVDDDVIAGPEHPLRFTLDPATAGVRPYIQVRGRLEARLTRAIALDLLALAVPDDIGDSFGIWSGGCFFALPAEAAP